MSRYFTFLTVFFITLAAVQAKPEAQTTAAAREVLTRVMGKDAVKRITLETLTQKDGLDHYNYESTADTLTLRGSSTIAICRSAYDYIRANNMGTVGWAGSRLNIPDKWPVVTLTDGGTPFKIRHCYNVVTAGYTFPYWNWERWQQELDWLAMHGYNMIMAPIATEAIATRVWRKMGFTEKEIDEYYVGPAHLPWQRMGNIRQLGGKLNNNWHQDQVKLQHQLLKRMRRLGIEPVIQSFAGFVPPAIKRIHPDIVLHNTHWNGGLPMSSRPVVMMPDDPLFASITKDFLTEWQKEFGKAKYILVDSFNEIQLPKTDTPVTKLLANYGKKTYEAITAAAPDAVWTLQGWMFNYQRNIWNKDTVKALLDAVPDDRLLILDYANDYNPNWDDFEGFHGKTWVMGYVPNMGAKTAYVGKMDFYANQVAKTLASSEKGNLVGFTISGEGLENNEVIYELMSDTAWSRKAIDVPSWLDYYVKNRYQSDDPILKEAWHELHKSVYSWFTPHPSFAWQQMRLGHGNVYRDDKFIAAVQKFLSVAKAHHDNANYRDDAVEMASLALSIRADQYFAVTEQFISFREEKSAIAAGKKAIELLLQADRLLESHSLNRLDRWVALARSHKGTKKEKDAYEANAKQIVTIWGPPVNDYSCRVWSGLIRDFYVPRMKQVLSSKMKGKSFDRHSWEAEWVNSQGISKVSPFTNPAEAAAKIVKQAYSEKVPRFQVQEKGVLARWTPSDMKTEWTTIDFPFSAKELKSMKGVRFIFLQGDHKLDIQSAAIIADGKQISIDKHNGATGSNHTNNYYKFDLPKNISANNSCALRVVVKSSGGTNSAGKIVFIE